MLGKQNLSVMQFYFLRHYIEMEQSGEYKQELKRLYLKNLRQRQDDKSFQTCDQAMNSFNLKYLCRTSPVTSAEFKSDFLTYLNSYQFAIEKMGVDLDFIDLQLQASVIRQMYKFLSLVVEYVTEKWVDCEFEVKEIINQSKRYKSIEIKREEQFLIHKHALTIKEVPHKLTITAGDALTQQWNHKTQYNQQQILNALDKDRAKYYEMLLQSMEGRTNLHLHNYNSKTQQTLRQALEVVYSKRYYFGQGIKSRQINSYDADKVVYQQLRTDITNEWKNILLRTLPKHCVSVAQQHFIKFKQSDRFISVQSQTHQTQQKIKIAQLTQKCKKQQSELSTANKNLQYRQKEKTKLQKQKKGLTSKINSLASQIAKLTVEGIQLNKLMQNYKLKHFSSSNQLQKLKGTHQRLKKQHNSLIIQLKKYKNQTKKPAIQPEQIMLIFESQGTMTQLTWHQIGEMQENYKTKKHNYTKQLNSVSSNALPKTLLLGQNTSKKKLEAESLSSKFIAGLAQITQASQYKRKLQQIYLQKQKELIQKQLSEQESQSQSENSQTKQMQEKKQQRHKQPQKSQQIKQNQQPIKVIQSQLPLQITSKTAEQSDQGQKQISKLIQISRRKLQDNAEQNKEEDQQITILKRINDSNEQLKKGLNESIKIIIEGQNNQQSIIQSKQQAFIKQNQVSSNQIKTNQTITQIQQKGNKKNSRKSVKMGTKIINQRVRKSTKRISKLINVNQQQVQLKQSQNVSSNRSIQNDSTRIRNQRSYSKLTINRLQQTNQYKRQSQRKLSQPLKQQQQEHQPLKRKMNSKKQTKIFISSKKEQIKRSKDKQSQRLSQLSIQQQSEKSFNRKFSKRLTKINIQQPRQNQSQSLSKFIIEQVNKHLENQADERNKLKTKSKKKKKKNNKLQLTDNVVSITVEVNRLSVNYETQSKKSSVDIKTARQSQAASSKDQNLSLQFGRMRVWTRQNQSGTPKFKFNHKQDLLDSIQSQYQQLKKSGKMSLIEQLIFGRSPRSQTGSGKGIIRFSRAKKNERMSSEQFREQIKQDNDQYKISSGQFIMKKPTVQEKEAELIREVLSLYKDPTLRRKVVDEGSLSSRSNLKVRQAMPVSIPHKKSPQFIKLDESIQREKGHFWQQDQIEPPKYRKGMLCQSALNINRHKRSIPAIIFNNCQLQLFGGSQEAYRYQQKHPKFVQNRQDDPFSKLCQNIYAHLQKIRHIRPSLYYAMLNLVRYPYDLCVKGLTSQDKLPLAQQQIYIFFKAVKERHKGCKGQCPHIHDLLSKIGFAYVSSIKGMKIQV